MERESERATRCATCQDLVVEEPPSFDVGIENIIRSSERCSICFLLYQACGIPQSIMESPVQKIQIVKSKPEQGPVLILRSDDSNGKETEQVLRLFNTTPGLKTISLVFLCIAKWVFRTRQVVTSCPTSHTTRPTFRVLRWHHH